MELLKIAYEDNKTWIDFDYPDFIAPASKYRIKPEPRTYWMILENNTKPWATFDNENEAKDYLKNYNQSFQLIKLIEVL